MMVLHTHILNFLPYQFLARTEVVIASAPTSWSPAPALFIHATLPSPSLDLQGLWRHPFMSEDKNDALRIFWNYSDLSIRRAYILLDGARLLTNIPHCCTYALDLSQIQCGRSTFQTRLRDIWLVKQLL
jgi:hypothetical protein